MIAIAHLAAGTLISRMASHSEESACMGGYTQLSQTYVSGTSRICSSTIADGRGT